MTCHRRIIATVGEKAAIAALFAAGKPLAAAYHRLGKCKDAGDCGQLCDWLAKDEGRPPSCIEPGGKVHAVNLYEWLKRPEAACPRGRF